MGRAEHRLNAIDWVVRGCIALVFIVIALEKFGTSWVKLFAEIGLGQWLRYFTGSLQILGSLLLLLPRVARIGVAVLGCTMVGAILVHVFILRDPGAVLVPAIFLGLISLCWPERGAAEAESNRMFQESTFK